MAPLLLGLLLCLGVGNQSAFAQTFSAGSLPLAIPDPGNLNNTITVSGLSGTVATADEVQVNVKISHAWASDIVVGITPPGGSEILIVNRIGGGSNIDMVSTNTLSFRNNAAGVVPVPGLNGIIPSGIYLPSGNSAVGSLASLIGATRNGDWMIRVRDDDAIIAGTLAEASITFFGPCTTVPTAITLANVSACDGNDTNCSTDDTFTADVTVTYAEKPATGSLSLTGAIIQSAVPAVDVANVGATSHTFTGVMMFANGSNIVLTSGFSEGCDDLTETLGPAPACGITNCNITNISLANASGCINPDGTVSPDDDYFTADVTVTFTYAEAGVDLVLLMGNTVLASTSNDLSCTSTYTFLNVELPANGAPVELTAIFGAMPCKGCILPPGTCTYTSGTLMTAPVSCSCQPTTAFTTCPGNQSVNVAPASCSALVNYTALANGDPAPSYTYNYTGATTDSGAGTISNNGTFNRGVTNVTITANNGCGTATCQFTVTVTDNIAPSVTCKPFTAVLVNGGAAISPADVYQTGSDNCGSVNLVSVTPSSFSCANVGANTVTLLANDGNGNSSTCTATVTIVDNQPPTAACQNITVQLNVLGQGTATAQAVNDGSYDNCGISSLSLSQTAFTCADIGAAGPTLAPAGYVILTVTDNNGNTATCYANVTVQDNVPPQALCKNITVNLDANGNGSTTAQSINNGSNDACGISSISASPLNFTCDNIGQNTVTLTVSDNYENTSTCTSTVTVKDVTPPTATCQGFTVDLNSVGQFPLNPDMLFTGGSDNCGTVNLQSVYPSILSCNHIGQKPVVLTVNDGHGNTGTCTAIMTVNPFIIVTSVVATPVSCAGDDGTITITATSVAPQLGYSIDGGVSFKLVGYFDDLNPGSYNLVVRAFGAAGCDYYYGTVIVGGQAGGQIVWYKDIDGDGYTDGVTLTGCTQPIGYVASALPGDCNDNDPLQRPGQIWYRDADNDGHSNGQTLVQCAKPAGYKVASQLLQTSGDCNDANANIHPGATELCNNLDDDCDGFIDENLSDLVYNGNVTFSTQAQANNWSQCYTVINGNLLIQNGGINNLAKLSNLRKVTGSVTIKLTSLDSVSWLLELDSIGGSLVINNNAKLSKLNGLDNLVSVGKDIRLYNNTLLTQCCAIYDLINETNGHYVGANIVVLGNKTTCETVPMINNYCDGNFTSIGEASLLAPPVQIGLDAVEQEKTLAIYPNPASEQLTVRIGGAFAEGQLSAFDLTGRLVLSQKLEAGTDMATLSVGDWQRGIYLVRVLLDGQVLSQKLIVE